MREAPPSFLVLNEGCQSVAKHGDVARLQEGYAVVARSGAVLVSSSQLDEDERALTLKIDIFWSWSKNRWRTMGKPDSLDSFPLQCTFDIYISTSNACTFASYWLHGEYLGRGLR